MWASVADIPDYILMQILMFIPPRYLWFLGSVSKRFLRLSRAPAVWVEALKQQQSIWTFDCSDNIKSMLDGDLTCRYQVKRILKRLEGLEILVELMRGSSIKFKKRIERPRRSICVIPIGIRVHDVTASYDEKENKRTIRFTGEYWNNEREERIKLPLAWSMSYFGKGKWTLESSNAAWSDIINMSCRKELEPYYTYKNLAKDISEVPPEFKKLYKMASEDKLSTRFLVGVVPNGGTRISAIWYTLEEERFACNPYRTLGFYLGEGSPTDQRMFYDSVNILIADRGSDNRLPNPLCEDFSFSSLLTKSKKRSLE
jgi:hypothetical protein